LPKEESRRHQEAGGVAELRGVELAGDPGPDEHQRRHHQGPEAELEPEQAAPQHRRGPRPAEAAADRGEAQGRGAQAELQGHPQRHDRLLEQHVGADRRLLRDPHQHHAAQESERHPHELAEAEQRAAAHQPGARLAAQSLAVEIRVGCSRRVQRDGKALSTGSHVGGRLPGCATRRSRKA
jgi:hypothetical protein